VGNASASVSTAASFRQDVLVKRARHCTRCYVNSQEGSRSIVVSLKKFLSVLSAHDVLVDLVDVVQAGKNIQPKSAKYVAKDKAIKAKLKPGCVATDDIDDIELIAAISGKLAQILRDKKL